MTDLAQTWRTAPRRAPSAPVCHAILVHIYPSGTLMGSRYVLHEAPLTIGRGPDCEVRIQDSSVSRHHARIHHDGDGYFVCDLQSTNGTYVNDKMTASTRLKDGDYVRVGNCIYRFLAGDNIEAAYHEEIYRRAIIDALTEVHNKRYLLEFLERELARTFRYKRPLSLVVFDIDHFKSINDRMGHLAGDLTLRELAACVKELARKGDDIARYGGDEFVVVLPETATPVARECAERLRAAIAERPFEFEGNPYRVTVSMGVAGTDGTERITPDDLIQRADAKLYAAKNAGRNRVEA